MNEGSVNPRDILKKRIAPGIWEDANGNPHYSVPELLELFDIPDTPENRQRVFEDLRQVVKQKCPNAKIIVRLVPDP